MNTTNLQNPYYSKDANTKLPTTPRGRALHTIDWFLNGKPVLRSHDNPQLDLRHGCHC